MKFLHLSDLHLGKRVNEFSMIEDQKFILKQIINIIDCEQPNGVIIAGDVYDKSVPSVEAVQLFDDFLNRLAKRKLQVFVISGNHDSAERIAFGAELMSNSGIHMSQVYSGQVTPISLQDDFGTVDIFMLPFVKPVHVRAKFPEADIESYTDAIQTAIEHMEINKEHRNIIVTHQFVTGASRSESEEISVGGSDNVDASVFEPFDYVALGHIHAPQNIKNVSNIIRYCGTPLKYSFSEANQTKSVTMVEVCERDCISVRTVDLQPMHDMREIKGTYEELTSKEKYENTATDDYIHITLTDEQDVPDAIGKLRVIYPNLMKLDYDNKRTRTNSAVSGTEEMKSKSPIELFGEFYEKQNNQEMTEQQKEFVSNLIEKVWEDEV